MANTATNKAPKATNKAPKAAPAPTSAAPQGGNTPAVAAPTTQASAPLFTCTANTWPVKSQGGNTIRAYAYKIAMQLAAHQPKGFTQAEYKAALVAGQVGKNDPVTGYATPSAGWASHNMATWASNPKQAWLVPANS